MNLPHNKFCVLPWVSLETSPVGTVRPCCLAEEEITDNAGEKFNLGTAEFGMIQNSQYMRNLRREFLDGKQPQTCRKCFREERAGRTSKRMHTLERLKHMLPTQDWTIDAKPLMFLDLKLGNIPISQFAISSSPLFKSLPTLALIRFCLLITSLDSPISDSLLGLILSNFPILNKSAFSIKFE
jgi:hypothetical protein